MNVVNAATVPLLQLIAQHIYALEILKGLFTRIDFTTCSTQLQDVQIYQR